MSLRPHRLKYSFSNSEFKPLLVGVLINHYIPILKDDNLNQKLNFFHYETDALEGMKKLEIDLYIYI